MVIRAYTYLHAFKYTNKRVSFVGLAENECIGGGGHTPKIFYGIIYECVCTPRTVDGVVSDSDNAIVVRTRRVHDKRTHKADLVKIEAVWKQFYGTFLTVILIIM